LSVVCFRVGNRKRLVGQNSYNFLYVRHVLYLQHSVVFYEQDGDDIYQFRSQADLVRVPDPEILQVRISTYCI